MPAMKPFLNVAMGGGQQGGVQSQPGPGTFPGGPPVAPQGGLGGMLANQFQAPKQPLPQPQPQPQADQTWIDRQARRASGGGFQQPQPQPQPQPMAPQYGKGGQGMPQGRPNGGIQQY